MAMLLQQVTLLQQTYKCKYSFPVWQDPVSHTFFSYVTVLSRDISAGPCTSNIREAHLPPHLQPKPSDGDQIGLYQGWNCPPHHHLSASSPPPPPPPPHSESRLSSPLLVKAGFQVGAANSC